MKPKVEMVRDNCLKSVLGHIQNPVCIVLYLHEIHWISVHTFSYEEYYKNVKIVGIISGEEYSQTLIYRVIVSLIFQDNQMIFLHWQCLDPKQTASAVKTAVLIKWRWSYEILLENDTVKLISMCVCTYLNKLLQVFLVFLVKCKEMRGGFCTALYCINRCRLNNTRFQQSFILFRN